MCLSRVISTNPTPHNEIVIAWKVFRKVGDNKRLVGQHQTLLGRWFKGYDTGVWYDDSRSFKLRMGASWRGGVYPRGFHAFATRSKARTYLKRKHDFGRNTDLILKRVQLQKVHTLGEQYSQQVLVACRMMITKEKA